MYLLDTDTVIYNQQTIELHALKLTGMAEALKDRLPQPDIQRLSFEDVSDSSSIASGHGRKTAVCIVISKMQN